MDDNQTQIDHEKRKLTYLEKQCLVEEIKSRNLEKAKELIAIMDDIDEEICYEENDCSFTETIVICCCRFGFVEMVNFLIKLNVNINKVGVYDYSLLMVAIENNHFEIVKILISSNVDINYVTKEGSSALSLATYENSIESFELLIASGVDLKKYGGISLSCASLKGNIYFVERLIGLGVDVNYIYSNTGWTPLHYACYYDQFNIVKFLLDNSADVNIRNKDGKTPIEWTANEEIKELIRNYNTTSFVLK